MPGVRDSEEHNKIKYARDAIYAIPNFAAIGAHSILVIDTRRCHPLKSGGPTRRDASVNCAY